MIDERLKMLVVTVEKLFSRGASHNIQRILAKTHTADVAVLIEALRPDQALEIFAMETAPERRAQVISYLDADLQPKFLATLDKDSILQLVSLMDSDDAADLLGRLPDEESKDLLESMQKEDSEEVADLMGYPEDSAGGIMSSDYLGLDQNLSVQEAIKEIQRESDESSVAFYIYVVNDSGQLVGVVSLKQLLLTRPTEMLKEIMITSVISVSLDTDQEKVARIVERYDFLVIPVVDDTNKLMGVITVDDVIDVIREEAEEDLLAMGQAGGEVDATVFEHFKARIPWLLLSFLAGTVCFLIVYFIGYFQYPQPMVLPPLWVVAAFIPVMLSIGSMAGTQSATVAVGTLRAGFDQRRLYNFLRKELLLGVILSVFFGALVFILGVAWFYKYNVTIAFAGAMTLQILISVIIGSGFPILLVRAGMDPTGAPIPLFTAIADISAVAVLFGLYYAS